MHVLHQIGQIAIRTTSEVRESYARRRTASADETDVADVIATALTDSRHTGWSLVSGIPGPRTAVRPGAGPIGIATGVAFAAAPVAFEVRNPLPGNDLDNGQLSFGVAPWLACDKIRIAKSARCCPRMIAPLIRLEPRPNASSSQAGVSPRLVLCSVSASF